MGRLRAGFGASRVYFRPYATARPRDSVQPVTCRQRIPKVVLAVVLLAVLVALWPSGCAAASGNLAYGGGQAFQYDGWNRLVQVNEAIPNQGFTGPGPGADENPVAAQERWWPGRMLKHYKYDGLGRLVETQSPYPDVETALGRLRTERFYYDGVRRIQEVVTDPLLMLGLAAGSSNPELQQVATGVRRLKQSEEECRMLQALVTDQCLVKQILREAMLENSNA